MELFINDVAIDISISDGDTINSLLTAVMKELDDNLIIAAMAVDGDFFSIEDPQVLARPVSKISKIELSISSRKDLGISLLSNSKDFLQIGAQELKNGSLARRVELMSSLSWIIDCFDAIKNSLDFPPADIDILKAVVTNVLMTVDKEEDALSLDQMKSLGQELENLILGVDTLITKIQNEEQFTQENVYQQLQIIQQQLPELATQFQTGNDVLAIQNLGKVIDSIDMFLRFSASQAQNTEIEQYSLDFKDLSTQLLNAFENKDYILIADLIEYDLNDIIDNILEK